MFAHHDYVSIFIGRCHVTLRHNALIKCSRGFSAHGSAKPGLPYSIPARILHCVFRACVLRQRSGLEFVG